MVVNGGRRTITTDEQVGDEQFRSIKHWRREMGVSSTDREDSGSEYDRYAVVDGYSLNSRVEEETREDKDTRFEEDRCTRDEDENRQDTDTQREEERYGAHPDHTAQIDYMTDGDDAIIERKVLGVEDDEKTWDTGPSLDSRMRSDSLPPDTESKNETETRDTNTDDEDFQAMNSLDEFSSGVVDEDDESAFKYAETPRSMICDFDFHREDFLIKMSAESSMELTDTKTFDSAPDLLKKLTTPWSPKALIWGEGSDGGQPVSSAPEPPPSPDSVNKSTRPCAWSPKALIWGEGSDGGQPFSSAPELPPSPDSVNKSTTPWSPKALIWGEAPDDKPDTSAQEPLASPASLAPKPPSSPDSVNKAITPWSPKALLCGASDTPPVNLAPEPQTNTAEPFDELDEELRRVSANEPPFSVNETMQQDFVLSTPKKPMAEMEVRKPAWKAATAEALRHERASMPKTTTEAIYDVAADLFLLASPRQKPRMTVDTQFDEKEPSPKQKLDGLKQILSKRPLSPISPCSPKPTTRKSDVQQAVRDLCFVGEEKELERPEATLLLETAVRGSKVSKAPPECATPRRVHDDTHPFDEEECLTSDANRIVEESLAEKGNSFRSNDLVDLSGNVSVVPVSKATITASIAAENSHIPVCGAWQLTEIKEIVRDVRASMTRRVSDTSIRVERAPNDKQAGPMNREDTIKLKKIMKTALQSPRRTYSAHKFRQSAEAADSAMAVLGWVATTRENSLLSQVQEKGVLISPTARTDVSVPFDEHFFEEVEATLDDSEATLNNDMVELVRFETGLFAFYSQDLRINCDLKLKVDRCLPVVMHDRVVVCTNYLIPFYPLLAAMVADYKARNRNATTACASICYPVEVLETINYVKKWIACIGVADTAVNDDTKPADVGALELKEDERPPTSDNTALTPEKEDIGEDSRATTVETVETPVHGGTEKNEDDHELLKETHSSGNTTGNVNSTQNHLYEDPAADVDEATMVLPEINESGIVTDEKAETSTLLHVGNSPEEKTADADINIDVESDIAIELEEGEEPSPTNIIPLFNDLLLAESEQVSRADTTLTSVADEDERNIVVSNGFEIDRNGVVLSDMDQSKISKPTLAEQEALVEYEPSRGASCCMCLIP